MMEEVRNKGGRTVWLDTKEACGVEPRAGADAGLRGQAER